MESSPLNIDRVVSRLVSFVFVWFECQKVGNIYDKQLFITECQNNSLCFVRFEYQNIGSIDTDPSNNNDTKPEKLFAGIFTMVSGERRRINNTRTTWKFNFWYANKVSAALAINARIVQKRVFHRVIWMLFMSRGLFSSISKLNFDIETKSYLLRREKKLFTCQYQCVYVFTMPSIFDKEKNNIPSFGFDSRLRPKVRPREQDRSRREKEKKNRTRNGKKRWKIACLFLPRPLRTHHLFWLRAKFDFIKKLEYESVCSLFTFLRLNTFFIIFSLLL